MTKESRASDIDFLKLFADLLANHESRPNILRVTLQDRGWKNFQGYDDDSLNEYPRGSKAFKAFCRDKLRTWNSASGLSLSTRRILSAYCNEVPYIVITRLQSLPNLEKLTLVGCQLIDGLNQVLPRQLTGVTNVLCYVPTAFNNLTHVEIRGRIGAAWKRYFDAAGLAGLMSLPALKSLKVFEIFTRGSDDSHDGHATSPMSSIETEANLRKYSAPLETLEFQSSCVCFDDIEAVLCTARPRSLKDFRLHASLDNDDLGGPGSLYDPIAYLRILQQEAGDSLENFSMSVEDNYLAHTLRTEWSLKDFDDDYLDDTLPTEGGLNGSDISHYALDIRDTLRGFQRLKEIKVEAHLLLNGHGLIERVRKHCAVNHLPLFDDDDTSVNTKFKRFLAWAAQNLKKKKKEPFPLSQLLPRSLERLEISCTDFERPLMVKKLRDAIGNPKSGTQPKRFPHLRLVQLRCAASGESDGEEEEEPPYWSYQEVVGRNEK